MKKIIFFLLITMTVYAQSTIRVPADYSTIQGALNIAQSGDIVLVSPGTYYENIIWPNRNGIKLISEGDTTNCTIDGQNNGSVISIIKLTATIDSTTELIGFKIKNGGNVANGGGVVINNTSPKLKWLQIEKCSSTDFGGGLYIYGSPIIRYSKIINNYCSQFGGGVSVADGTPIFEFVFICNNRTSYYGGGIDIRFYADKPIFRNVVVYGNITNSNGGGIFALSDCNFKNTYIIKNQGSGGAGINYNSYATINPTISNLTISENLGIGAVLDGIGFYSWQNFSVTNITCMGNQNYGFVDNQGGALINNCNIFSNGIGIQNNNTTTFIDASNNWWGNSSGPNSPNFNPSGTGDITSTFVFPTPFLIQPSTTAPPYPVTNFHLTSINGNSASFSWDFSTLTDIVGYQLFYSKQNTEWDYTNSVVVGNTNVYTITDLDPNTTYYFSIRCFDNDGNESWFSPNVTVITEAALPVELVSFSTYWEQNLLKLNWRTATEVNNYGFEIERKLINTAWQKIGFVQGHGNSNSPKDYLFTDLNPHNGKVKYRLKQLDFDGTYEYSEEVELEINGTIGYNLKQNFPNPFNPITKITYHIANNSHVILKIYDVLGNEIKTLVNQYKHSGIYTIEFDATGLPSGIYYYQLIADSFKETKKLILTK